MFILLRHFYFFIFVKNTKDQSFFAIVTALVAFVYRIFDLLFTYFFYVFISFIFKPLVFYKNLIFGFYYRLNSFGIVFLCILASIKFWKITIGSILNLEQMSVIETETKANIN